LRQYSALEQKMEKLEGGIKMVPSPVEMFRDLPKKVCPECGEYIEEQAESYMMECDRCLANKEE